MSDSINHQWTNGRKLILYDKHYMEVSCILTNILEHTQTGPERQTPDLLPWLAWKWLPPVLLVGTHHHFPGKKGGKGWDSCPLVTKEEAVRMTGAWVGEQSTQSLEFRFHFPIGTRTSCDLAGNPTHILTSMFAETWSPSSKLLISHWVIRRTS